MFLNLSKANTFFCVFQNMIIIQQNVTFLYSFVALLCIHDKYLKTVVFLGFFSTTLKNIACYS